MAESVKNHDQKKILLDFGISVIQTSGGIYLDVDVATSTSNIAIFYHPTGSKFQTVVPRDRIQKKPRSKGSRDLIAETNSFAFENRPFTKDILLMEEIRLKS